MITTAALTKHYGSRRALDGVDMHVPAGAVYGLVGPNGSGKTTLLSLLAGLRRPTSGEIRVEVAARQVAVLPDTPRFDRWLTGREVVALAQRLASGGTSPARVDEVLTGVGLADACDRAVGGYSRGMLQRLGMAATVVGSPRLLLLDEPASALDPLGRREMLDLVARIRGRATVLFSSHILADVQEVATVVGILHEGRLRFQGPLDELLVGSATPRYLVRLRPPVRPVAEHLRRLGWVRDVAVTNSEDLRLTVAAMADAERHLAGALAEAGARVISFGPEAVTLEQAFLELTE